MKADILIIGTVSEQVDRFLSQELVTCGITVGERRIAENAGEALRRGLGEALRQTDCVVICGELADGAVTTVASVLALPLEADEASEQRLEEYAAATGRPFSEAERRLSHLPRGASVFPNEHGALPGFAVEKYGQTVLLLPAAMSELVPMFQQAAAPYLAQKAGGASASCTIGVFGLSEAAVTARLSDLLAGVNPAVSFFSREGGEILVRITARAADTDAAAALCEPIAADIRERLGAFVYGQDAGSLQMVVVRLLAEKGMKIATAESCTAGLLSGKLTQVSGASAVFECGVAAYSKEIKRDVLGVSDEIMTEQGTVCADTACGMATGVRRVGGSDIGISITGEAGPTASEDKPVGTVFIALADSRRVWVKEIHAPAADRDTVREIATCQALDLTRRYLEALPAVMAGGQLLDDTALAAPIIPKAAPTKKRRLLSSVFPWKGDSRGALISKSLLWLGVLAVFIAVWFVLHTYLINPARNREQFVSLELLYTQGADSGYSVEDFPEGMLSRFYALYEQNPDVKGWVKIGGTSISYPVMQNSALDYSVLNFNREYSEYGVPYFDENVALATPQSVNRSFIIHGNNSGDGQMFSELVSYTGASFLLQHPVIEMNTIYATGTFEVFAVLYVDENDQSEFNYRTVAFDGNEEFLTFVNELQKRSFFTTSVNVYRDDTLLLLETDAAAHTGVEGVRLVVAARMLTIGETPTDDLEISFNANALMPSAMATGNSSSATARPTTTQYQSSDELPELELPDYTTTAEVTTTQESTTAASETEATDAVTSATGGASPTEPAVPDTTAPSATTTTDSGEPSATTTTEPTTTTTTTAPTQAPSSSGLPTESTFYSTLTVRIGSGMPAPIRTREELQYAVASIVKAEMGSARSMANSTEAQKAQAVASYTYMLYTCRNGGTFNIPAGLDLNNANDQKIYAAVGEVLGVKMVDMSQASVKNMPLCAMYSSSCSGGTASIQNVYTAALPYLQSVVSEYDNEETVRKYSGGGDKLVSTYTTTWSELKTLLDTYVKTKTDGAVSEVSLEEGDTPLFAKTFDNAGGYVVNTNAYYVHNGKTVYLRGIDIRQVIGTGRLRSHSFTVDYDESTDCLTFTVSGHGHGLGLSQYGAIGYANEAGWTYRQILTHYYSLSDNGTYRIVDPVWE